MILGFSIAGDDDAQADTEFPDPHILRESQIDHTDSDAPRLRVNGRDAPVSENIAPFTGGWLDERRVQRPGSRRRLDRARRGGMGIAPTDWSERVRS